MLIKFSIFAICFLMAWSMPVASHALMMAEKNIRSNLSGNKLTVNERKALPLNRSKGLRLNHQSMRIDHFPGRIQGAVPLMHKQHFLYQKSDDYAENPQPEAVEEGKSDENMGFESENPRKESEIDPFSHISAVKDPFGVQNPAPKMLFPQVQPMVKGDVPQNNAVGAFLPELTRSADLLEEVSYHHRWPVDEAAIQRVSSNFGPRKDPFTGEVAFHAGVDIAAPSGTFVRTSGDGTVYATGDHPRLGKYVRVDHPDGTYSLYGHLKSSSVSAGQVVLQGEVIGKVGASGRATGPHLDYSLRRNSVPMDPLKVLAMPEHLAHVQAVAPKREEG